MESVGARVRAARRRAGKSVTEVSRETGCSRASLAKLEQGTRDKTIVRFARLARSVGCTMDELVPDALIGAQPERGDDEIPF